MTTMYANQDGVIIWSGGDQSHKQGRVDLDTEIVIIREYAQNWYIIEKPVGMYLGDVVDPPDDPNYPQYWVRREFCSPVPTTDPGPDPDPEDPEPEPDPSRVSDEEFAGAIAMVIKYLKQPLG
jgi:hypothetical protein